MTKREYNSQPEMLEGAKLIGAGAAHNSGKKEKSPKSRVFFSPNFTFLLRNSPFLPAVGFSESILLHQLLLWFCSILIFFQGQFFLLFKLCKIVID
jgi:hypothetical protein